MLLIAFKGCSMHTYSYYVHFTNSVLIMHYDIQFGSKSRILTGLVGNQLLVSESIVFG